MVTIKVKQTDELTLPKCATVNADGSNGSAGYDIIATSEPKIVGLKLEDKYFSPDEKKIDWWKYISYIEYETNLSIEPSDKDIHTLILPRSSISNKTNLVLANSVGLIDNDYRGKITCRFKYVWQPYDMLWLSVKDYSDPKSVPSLMILGTVDINRIYKKGDTIAQLILNKTINANFEIVNDLSKTTRGEGGYGSTDIKPQTSTIVTPTVAAPIEHKPTEFKQAGPTLSEIYNKLGGVQVKKKYSDELKEHRK